MTYSDAGKILSVLTVAYPKLADNNATERVSLWAGMFDTESYETVAMAVKTFIATDVKGFPPTIGQIKEIISKITTKEEMTSAEAVALIVKATKNGLYGSVEEFEKLPEICKKIVVSPERLKDWAMLDADEVNTVIASNLRRAFDVQVKRDKEYKALPNDVKQLMAGLQLALEEK